MKNIDPLVLVFLFFVGYIALTYGWLIFRDWRTTWKGRLRNDTTAPRNTDGDSGSHPPIN